MQPSQTSGRQSMTHGSSAKAERFELGQRYDTVLRARATLDLLIRTPRSRLRPKYGRNLDLGGSGAFTGRHVRMVTGRCARVGREGYESVKGR